MSLQSYRPWSNHDLTILLISPIISLASNTKDDSMQKIAISKFKATCLAVLEQVRQTGQPILVTRFGHPVAEISPPGASLTPVRKLGTLAGTMQIVGDIVGPVSDESDWEAAGE